MANKNITQLTQQGVSADPTSLLYAVVGLAGSQSDTSLPLSVFVNNLGLTGTPTAPTAAPGTNTTQIASTAFVQAALGSYLQKANNLSDVANAATARTNLGAAATSGTLAQFAATTSAQLAGVISDETGSGALVFASGPTFGALTSTGLATLNSLTTGSATVTGGTINGTSVGATTASTGAFTTLSASGTVSGTGFSTYLASPPAIGGTAANTGKFTTLQATGAITPSSTAGVVGTTTNDNANAGSVGEYATNTTTGTSVTSLTPFNATSVSLTAGDWDIMGVIKWNPAGTTVISQTVASINNTSATLGGLGTLTATPLIANGAGASYTILTPMVRLSLAATTTIYLVGNANFSTSTLTADGFIRARRVR